MKINVLFLRKLVIQYAKSYSISSIFVWPDRGCHNSIPVHVTTIFAGISRIFVKGFFIVSREMWYLWAAINCCIGSSHFSYISRNCCDILLPQKIHVLFERNWCTKHNRQKWSKLKVFRLIITLTIIVFY
jgi:hypothetical protein